MEKVKRITEKYNARLVENVIPGVVYAKRLAYERDHSELPNKKRLVSHFGQEHDYLIVEVVVQPHQQQ